MTLLRFLPLALLLPTLSLEAQPAPPTLPTTSPAARVYQRLGVTDIEVAYHRPGTRGREIFGALVPHGRVWRTGADSATTISFSTPVTLNGAAVAAGTYELFTIPGEDEWTVIVHENRSQWGSYRYDPAHDVARFAARPRRLAAPVETLTFSFTDLSPAAATLELAWAGTAVPVRVEVDVVATVVPVIEAAMQGEGRKPWFAAAMFYYDNRLDTRQAAAWMAAALKDRPDHLGMLHRQALILERLGDRDGAIAAARRSRELAAAAAPELRDEYLRLNATLLARLGASDPPAR